MRCRTNTAATQGHRRSTSPTVQVPTAIEESIGALRRELFALQQTPEALVGDGDALRAARSSGAAEGGRFEMHAVRKPDVPRGPSRHSRDPVLPADAPAAPQDDDPVVVVVVQEKVAVWELQGWRGVFEPPAPGLSPGGWSRRSGERRRLGAPGLARGGRAARAPGRGRRTRGPSPPA